ncbi:hypothetical protein GIB67_029952 [Kingdonia uniflora]|uniref:Uncharacterized protein n=1 Tax=Kingdonia uniflora TaxID=39325 RepID=A0A7J7MY10_9MAGN|nr:hypothetical protein GIB67_029952 [Kingdonia uniflora]
MVDVAHNNLSGSIPRCFSNLSAMVTKKDTNVLFVSQILDDAILLSSKEPLLEYKPSMLSLVTSMDLSHNSLSGEIPQEKTSLLRLQYLLLSNNHLTGEIPQNIGVMVSLENLDLSKNQLTGVIPQSISRLTSLAQLNLSHNNLSGEISTGPQLQTFTESSYVGNDGLCGTPLMKKCNGNGFGETSNTEAQDSDEYDIYVAVAPGFLIQEAHQEVDGGLAGVRQVEDPPRRICIPARDRLCEGSGDYNSREGHVSRPAITAQQYVTQEHVEKCIKELFEAQAQRTKDIHNRLQKSPIAQELLDGEVPTSFYIPKICKCRGTGD